MPYFGSFRFLTLARMHSDEGSLPEITLSDASIDYHRRCIFYYLIEVYIKVRPR